MFATRRQAYFAKHAIDCFAENANYPRMARSDEDIVREWLREQLERRGRGARIALSRHLGVGADVITRILNTTPGKESRAFKAGELIKAAEFFGVPSPLQFPDSDDGWDARPTRPKLVPVRKAGIAAAGMFHEVDELDQTEPEIFWEPEDPRFPGVSLFSAEVRGDSMNALQPRAILEGDRVTGPSYPEIEDRVPISDGMVVVIQRSRDGGQTLEWSVKQVEFYKDRVEFHPRSTNPKYKPIVVMHDAHADNGVEVKVLALITRITSSIL